MAAPAQSLLQALAEPDTAEPCIVLESTSPCKILLANPSWCEIVGYNSEEVVGNSISLLWGPLTCRETLAALSLAMAGA